MQITNSMTQEEREHLKIVILEKAKKINPELITKKNIRENPDLIASEDHIYRLFGGISKLKNILNLKGHYKTDRDIILAVRSVSEKLKLSDISREIYLKHKSVKDPSANAQYRFIKENNIKDYPSFIKYCLEYRDAFSNQYSFEKEDLEKEKINFQIKELLDKGYYDKEIERDFNISASAVKRFREQNNIKSNYQLDLEELRRG